MGLSGISCDMNALGRCSRLDTDAVGSMVTKKDGVGHPRPTPSSIGYSVSVATMHSRFHLYKTGPLMRRS